MRGWSEDQNRAVAARYGDTSLPTLLDHVDELADDGILALPSGYRRQLHRQRHVIAVMHRVFHALRTGSKLDSGYRDDDVRRALDQIA